MALGLLAACITTIIGIVHGNQPETILYRCLVAASVVTCLATLMRSLWRLADPDSST